MPDTRFTWAVILDVLRTFETAGYRRGDEQHVGLAILVLRDAARIFAGEADQPRYLPGAPLPVPGTGSTEADRQPVPPQPDAAAKLEEVRAVLAAFDWATNDRQYALEQIEGIVNGDAR